MRYLKSLAWALAAAFAAGAVRALVQIGFGVDEIRATGSGGLGAVSFGMSEALLEAGSVVFVIVLAWRLWTTRSRS